MPSASYEVGSAWVQILPSFAGAVEAIGAQAEQWGQDAGEVFAETFKSIVNAELKDMSAVKIDADTSEASAKARALRAEIGNLNAMVDLGIDETDTQEKLVALQVELDALELEHPEIRIGVDTGDAEAKLGAFDADVLASTAATDALGGSAGSEGAAGGLSLIGTNAVAAAGELSPMVAGMVALGAALVPIGGLALGAFAALPALIGGAATGMGALYLGFSGIFGTLRAFNKSQTTGGGAGSSGASSALSNADAERSAANSVQTAEEALTNSRVNGARSVAAAQAAAAQATVSADQAVITAENNLVNAERAVTQAQWNEQQAQEAVIAARQNAQNQLDNYTNQLADGAIAQQQAALNLVEAKQALDAANAPGSTATDNQKTQAQISFEQATQAVTDLNTQQSQLAVTATAAAAAGVEGNQQVIAAEHNLQQATQAVTDAVTAQGIAQQNVAAAMAADAAQQITNQDNIAQAQKKSAQTVADAERSLTQALDNQKSAFERAAIPVASGSSAINTYARDFAKLSPAGQDFVKFVTGQLFPVFDGLKDKVQAAFLPLIQTGLTDLLPFFKDLGPLIVDAAKGIGGTFDELAKFIGSKKGLAEVMTIFKEGNGFMSQMGGAAVTLFEAFTGAGAQSGGIVKALGDGIVHLVDSFAKWVSDGGFQKFLAWVKENGPSIVSDIKDLVTGVLKFVVAVTPIGLILDKVVGYFGDFVGWLIKSDPLFLPVAAGIAAIALVVAALSSPIVLIVGGLTLLVLGVTLLATHWHEVWTNIKNWADDAWQFIDTHLFQPIGDFFTKTIPHAFDDFVSFCKALPGRALAALGDLAKYLWGGLVIDATWLDTHVWQPISTFFTGLPVKIGHAAEHMWDGLGAAFATVYDKIIGWWNDLHLSIPAIHVLGVEIFPGATFGTPNLPLLNVPSYHTGGVVGGVPGVEQLALLMPGEVVTPANTPLPGPSSIGALALNLTVNGADLASIPAFEKVVVDAFQQFADNLTRSRVA